MENILLKYQRFVAYIYEYRRGKKENNCGFFRVEVRDGNITVEVHMKCPELPEDEKCCIYGFIRNAEYTEGVLLGEMSTFEGRLDCMLESAQMDHNSWKNEFSKFGGMIIQTEHGAFFGTEWDDQTIKPEKFVVKSNLVEETKNKMEDREYDTYKEEIEILQENTQKEEPEAIQLNQINIPMENIENTDVEVSESIINKSEDMSTQEIEHKKQPAFCPFHDGEITECRKVHPSEFFKYCSPNCALRTNRFLEHGYYNFGHLIVGTRKDGKHILGVPGGYDQQERFMANMFGFPYFKESGEIQLPGGRGGYWYRLINSSDSNKGNCFF